MKVLCIKKTQGQANTLPNVIDYWIITVAVVVAGCRLHIAANQRRIHVSVLDSTQRSAQDFVEARILVVGPR